MDELESEDAFGAWFQSEINWIIDPAWAAVHQAVAGCLSVLDTEMAALEGVHRDRWQVFAPHPIKAPARVRAKILENPARPATLTELDDDEFETLLASLGEDYDIVLDADGARFRSKVMRERWALREAWSANEEER